MTLRLMIGILALSIMSTCLLISSLKAMQMADRVNEKFPKQDRFKPSWWHTSKQQRLILEYKRLYPDGRLLTQHRIAMWAGFGCLPFVAWGFGFFPR
jgi:hypothetical protein